MVYPTKRLMVFHPCKGPPKRCSLFWRYPSLSMICDSVDLELFTKPILYHQWKSCTTWKLNHFFTWVNSGIHQQNMGYQCWGSIEFAIDIAGMDLGDAFLQSTWRRGQRCLGGACRVVPRCPKRLSRRSQIPSDAPKWAPKGAVEKRLWIDRRRRHRARAPLMAWDHLGKLQGVPWDVSGSVLVLYGLLCWSQELSCFFSSWLPGLRQASWSFGPDLTSKICNFN